MVQTTIHLPPPHIILLLPILIHANTNTKVVVMTVALIEGKQTAGSYLMIKQPTNIPLIPTRWQSKVLQIIENITDE